MSFSKYVSKTGIANQLVKKIWTEEKIYQGQKTAQRQKTYYFHIENIYIPVPKYTPFNVRKRSWENESSICSFPKTA